MVNEAPHERYTAHLRTPSPTNDPDAGLKGLNHYERRLPRWRFNLRQQLIPVVRWETPYLAWIQQASRRPFLDSYFAISANLGTHTCFMTALPICYWCGYPEVGMALVHMLALGVYLSGYIKDMVCLPRPLSPPLHRITMSGSAALEYGFPSTHTTNAISVALFCLQQLHNNRDDFSDVTYQALRILCYCYAISISLGRMYCGMHGFFDVIAGGALGALIAALRIQFGIAFDTWLIQGSWTRVLVPVAALLIAVRVHPEPADNCPCFDDSVAFVGVVMGVSAGLWQRAHHSDNSNHLSEPLSTFYTFNNTNLFFPISRVLIGIVSIFVWRAVAKPVLLRVLPPIFRFVDHWGFRLPRRYFLQSRDYKTVPPLPKDGEIIPPASEIPALVSTLRHPRRRAISIGPQSEADAREMIANREQRRRNSRANSQNRPELQSRLSTDRVQAAASNGHALPSPRGLHDHESSKTDTSTIDKHANLLSPTVTSPEALGQGDNDEEKSDRAMFMALEKPRIRYDVEVITKLVVYAGIAWLALAGNPILFEFIGLA